MTSQSAIEASSRRDVIVIGAGPAGAIAAFQLAGSGLDTLLVDRQRFPRAKVCGGCVSREAMELMRSIGLGSVLNDLPGRRFRSLELVAGRRAAIRLRLPDGMAVTRPTLDQALVRSAVQAGAAFVDGVTARVTGPDASDCGFRRVSLSGPCGGEVSVSARVVVVADGLAHPSLGGLPEFVPTRRRGSRIGLGTVLADGADYDVGTIHMAVAPFGYAGLVRAEAATLDIAAAIDPVCIKRFGGAPGAVRSILERAGLQVPERLGEARWQGTSVLTRRLGRPAGWRVLVIGDAAGYVEPFTGEGIARAVADAAAVPAFVRRGLAGWTERIESDWVATRRRAVANRQRVCRAITLALRFPVATTIGTWALARCPDLAEQSVRALLCPARPQKETLS